MRNAELGLCSTSPWSRSTSGGAIPPLENPGYCRSCCHREGRTGQTEPSSTRPRTHFWELLVAAQGRIRSGESGTVIGVAVDALSSDQLRIGHAPPVRVSSKVTHCAVAFMVRPSAHASSADAIPGDVAVTEVANTAVTKAAIGGSSAASQPGLSESATVAQHGSRCRGGRPPI